MQAANSDDGADAPNLHFYRERQDYLRHAEEYTAGMRAAEEVYEQNASDHLLGTPMRQMYELPQLSRKSRVKLPYKGLLFELAADKPGDALYNKDEYILQRADAILQKAAPSLGNISVDTQDRHQVRVVRMGALIRSRYARKQQAMDSILNAAAGECLSYTSNSHPTCSLDYDWLIFTRYRGHNWRSAAQHERAPLYPPRDGYRRGHRRLHRTSIAPVVIEEDCDQIDGIADCQHGKYALTTISGADFSTQRCEFKPPAAVYRADEQEIYFDRVEQMIREAELPADRMQALAALSHLGSINTAAYKDMLLKQVYTRRTQYKAEQQRE